MVVSYLLILGSEQLDKRVIKEAGCNAMNKSNFGTFLNIINTVSPAPQSVVDASGKVGLSPELGVANILSQSGDHASLVEILRYVNEHGGIVSTADLLSAMNMPIVTFAISLEKLRESQLVELEAAPSNSVSLTKAGELIAQLPADALSGSI